MVNICFSTDVFLVNLYINIGVIMNNAILSTVKIASKYKYHSEILLK